MVAGFDAPRVNDASSKFTANKLQASSPLQSNSSNV